MNSLDERSIVPIDVQVNNSIPNSIKIDSLCIKLGFVKEKTDAEKCSHFSIRGYVSGMRERGRSNFLPQFEELPPMDVPNFKYWLCQSCLQNCKTSNTSHETTPLSVCSHSQSMVKPCTRSFPPQHCDRAPVLPFGEGTSGLKHVDSMNDDDNDDDDDERIVPALGAYKSQPFQEIHANESQPFQEPTTICSSDSANVVEDSNTSTPDSVVKETVAGIVGPPIQSSQQNDCPNGHPRRKARKVRLLKELLCGNTENQQRKKENPALLDPKPSLLPLPDSLQIKRKMGHDQDQDQNQRSVDTSMTTGKKVKAFKGINPVPKATMIEHSKDPGTNEGGQNDNRYQWNKHGTQRSSINVGKVGGDPVTAWRSIFSDISKTDNQVTFASGPSKPTYDVSKDTGTESYSNFTSPQHPDKKFNAFKKISRKSLKSSKFSVEDSRWTDVSEGFRPKDRQSDMELGLGLSLKYDPQSQIRSIPSLLNRPLTQDHSRKGDFFLGESSIPHRIQSDSKSKDLVDDVSNRHAPRSVFFQEHRPFTYGSCSGHQKLDFSDPNKRNNGVRGYSDVMGPQNHQRQGKMVSMGRSDEREIIELLAKNQYERNLCETRVHHHRPPGGTNNNNFIPHSSGFHNVNMPSSHQEYLHMSEKFSMGPTTMMRNPNPNSNPPSGFFHQEQVSDFNIFDGFQHSQNQNQKQPPSGIWMSDSGPHRHQNSRYHHVLPKGNNNFTNNHMYTPSNMNVLEGFNKYHNGTQQNVYSNCPPFGHGYRTCLDKDKEKSVMDLDLNVMAPNSIEEQNNFGSLNMTSSSSSEHYHHHHHQKNTRLLDSSSYPNEAIPAMQLLSLMDAGKSNHQSNNTDERKFPKLPSNPYITGKTKPIPNSHFPYSRNFNSSSMGVGNSFSYGVESGQSVKLTGGQGYYKRKPQEDKSYDFPVPWHASDYRSDHVTLGTRIEPIETEICTINKNPADFSTPGPDNVYMINSEDLVFRKEGSYNGKLAFENVNGVKRQKKL